MATMLSGLPLRQPLGGPGPEGSLISGLIKLLHPDGEVEYLAYAMEMRRRVKEQLKKMGGLEYWDTSFSYIRESGQETFVPVPESGGGAIIAEGGLPPGSLHHRDGRQRQPTGNVLIHGCSRVWIRGARG